VVVHAPRHVETVADLSPDELRDVATAWQARARAAAAAGFLYVHALLNEGRPAGGSLPHSHSQLVLARELSEETRIVERLGGLVALCPLAGRAPYELLIAPIAPEPDAFGSEQLGEALVLLGRVVRRLRELEGDVPLNAWLHTGRVGARVGHWHLELVPRLTVAAGLELGAGVYVNPLPPEQAARALRRR
jgi:UDPglucose--hexose-1-phosphate uridylyltransferase